MNKASAILAMREGVKIQHESFASKEWMTMEGDDILLEDGVKCSQQEFWKWRTDEAFNTGYSVFVNQPLVATHVEDPFSNNPPYLIHNIFSDYSRYIGAGKCSPYVRKDAKAQRNEPCSCGSGKKFKNCCTKCH